MFTNLNLCNWGKSSVAVLIGQVCAGGVSVHIMNTAGGAVLTTMADDVVTTINATVAKVTAN